LITSTLKRVRSVGFNQNSAGSKGGKAASFSLFSKSCSRFHNTIAAQPPCMGRSPLAGTQQLPVTLPRAPSMHSLRVTLWNLSGGTHWQGCPASAAASLSTSLRAGGEEQGGCGGTQSQLAQPTLQQESQPCH
jgi:hypothetical protein